MLERWIVWDVRRSVSVIWNRGECSLKCSLDISWTNNSAVGAWSNCRTFNTIKYMRDNENASKMANYWVSVFLRRCSISRRWRSWAKPEHWVASPHSSDVWHRQSLVELGHFPQLGAPCHGSLTTSFESWPVSMFKNWLVVLGHKNKCLRFNSNDVFRLRMSSTAITRSLQEALLSRWEISRLTKIRSATSNQKFIVIFFGW